MTCLRGRPLFLEAARNKACILVLSILVKLAMVPKNRLKGFALDKGACGWKVRQDRTMQASLPPY